jgi:hypothetical protein
MLCEALAERRAPRGGLDAKTQAGAIISPKVQLTK